MHLSRVRLIRLQILNDACVKLANRCGDKINFESYISKGDWAGLLQKIKEIDNDAKNLKPSTLAMILDPNDDVRKVCSRPPL
jgi:hypothetical protein